MRKFMIVILTLAFLAAYPCVGCSANPTTGPAAIKAAGLDQKDIKILTQEFQLLQMQNQAMQEQFNKNTARMQVIAAQLKPYLPKPAAPTEKTKKP